MFCVPILAVVTAWRVGTSPFYGSVCALGWDPRGMKRARGQNLTTRLAHLPTRPLRVNACPSSKRRSSCSQSLKDLARVPRVVREKTERRNPLSDRTISVSPSPQSRACTVPPPYYARGTGRFALASEARLVLATRELLALRLANEPVRSCDPEGGGSIFELNEHVNATYPQNVFLPQYTH